METRSLTVLSVSLICGLLYGWSTGLDNTGQSIEYVYYTERRSWNEARNVCHSIGGELAKIDSQQTIEDIKQLALEKYPGENLLHDDFWIGLYDTPAERREWAVDCSPLTFTSNYVEQYHDSELCFKMRPDTNWEGYSKICAEDTAFLCEIHTAGSCSFTNETLTVYDVNFVYDYDVCEGHCAEDTTCSKSLFISPSMCFKLPYNTSEQGENSQLATIGSKFCLKFRKNITAVDPWENRLKYPVEVCGSIPTNNQSVGTPTGIWTISPTTSIVPTSSMTIQPSMSPCICTASPETTTETLTLTAIATLTEVDMRTAMLTQIATATLTQIETISVTVTQTSTAILTEIETTTAILTLAATTTATQVELTTVEVLQQCTPQTSTSPVTVHVTATPSCALPVVPSVTTPAPPNITQQEAVEMAEEISRNLTVDAKKTSAYLRSLISAPDDRKTSQAMGTVGIACIAVPLALILSSDIKGVLQFVRGLLTASNFLITTVNVDVPSYQGDSFTPHTELPEQSSTCI